MLKLPETEASLWRDFYKSSTYPSLTKSLRVEVVIIGGGITGLTAAYLLKKRGRTVAVLEKDTIGGGTSGRTTGKVTSQHDIIYADICERHGKATAQAYATINQNAVELIEQIVAEENIICDWAKQDNYIFSTNAKQVPELKNEVRVARELGLPASFETATPLPFKTLGAVKFTDQATFNSQRYLLGLAAAIDGQGSYIFERSKVIHIKEGMPCAVRTKQGQIVADNIITATNVPTLPLAARGTYCLLEYPQESYIVAARTNRELDGMYISPDKNHYSILPTIIDNEAYLLVGGEGHLSGLRINTMAKYKKLAAYAEAYLGAAEITHRWSDRDYLSYDRLPLIGKLYPHSKNLFVASAFSKWGLSGGTAAALILADLIDLGTSPYEHIFTPNRLSAVKAIPRATGRYIKERVG